MSGIEKYFSPESVEEAVSLLAVGETTMFAGGTDLMPLISAGKAGLAPVLVNVSRLSELKGVSVDAGIVRVGALTTVTEMLDSELLATSAPVLVETADCFAGGQVRNSATIGGNISNASPAADFAIPLILLDAEVEIAFAGGGCFETRRVPIAEFFTGPGSTVSGPKELVAAVYFSEQQAERSACFRKFGTRPAMDISIVSVGVAVEVNDGAFSNVRVAFGAVAPVPLRGKKTEAALEGSATDEETIAEAAQVAEEEVSPISDVRASAWYRKELVRVMTGRLLRDVARKGN